MNTIMRTTLKPVSVLHTKDAYKTHRSHDRDLALIDIIICLSKQKQCDKIVTVRQLMLMLCEREVERK